MDKYFLMLVGIFVVSTFFDILLCLKISKAKSVLRENNTEIKEHDVAIFDIKQKIQKCNKG